MSFLKVVTDEGNVQELSAEMLKQGIAGAVPGIRRIPAGPDAEEQQLPFSDAQGLSAVLPVRKGRGSGLYHGHFPRQARLPARHAVISVT